MGFSLRLTSGHLISDSRAVALGDLPVHEQTFYARRQRWLCGGPEPFRVGRRRRWLWPRIRGLGRHQSRAVAADDPAGRVLAVLPVGNATGATGRHHFHLFAARRRGLALGWRHGHLSRCDRATLGDSPLWVSDAGAFRRGPRACHGKRLYASRWSGIDTLGKVNFSAGVGFRPDRLRWMHNSRCKAMRRRRLIRKSVGRDSSPDRSDGASEVYVALGNGRRFRRTHQSCRRRRHAFVQDMTFFSTTVLSRESLLARFRPAVVGRPRWLAQYLGQGLCRIKWLSAAGILLWITQATGHNRRRTRAVSRCRRSTRRFLVDVDRGRGLDRHRLGLIVLVSGRGGVSIERARAFAVLAATTTVTAETLLFGLSGLAAERVASFDLSLLLVFSIMPLGSVAAIAVLAVAAVIALGSAYLIDYIRAGARRVHCPSAVLCRSWNRCQSVVRGCVQGEEARTGAAEPAYASGRTAESIDRGAKGRGAAAAR